MKRLALVTTLSLAMLAGLASVAVAEDGTTNNCTPIGSSGADFGQHVSMHNDMMGNFGGAMNPGMHQGYSTSR